MQTENENIFINKWEKPVFSDVSPSSEDKKPLSTYKSPEGFVLESYSSSWDENKLQELYLELKKNKHGEEIKTLSQIIVYGENSEDNILGSHLLDEKKSQLFISFPALSSKYTLEFFRPSGTISLYGGDECTTVESFSRTLSHEYGHHYTCLLYTSRCV